jgi:hypothetical protein
MRWLVGCLVFLYSVRPQSEFNLARPNDSGGSLDSPRYKPLLLCVVFVPEIDRFVCLNF